MVARRARTFAALCLSLAVVCSPYSSSVVFAQDFSTNDPSLGELDPLDPFDTTLPGLSSGITNDEEADKTKSADELLAEANVLLSDERLLEARTKLLRALAKDPTKYQAHILLSGYYMLHVGHFRLSLRYIKRAQELFTEQHGGPPYSTQERKAEHAHILYLLSQARLNLDDYQGSLDVLDSYQTFGYMSGWYPGTRSWVLMKLGRLDDAIKVARLGVFAGAEPGRTLNMLGILLSMKGERRESIQVFDDAITYEMALGELGQPATPLNNVGEVYREIFDEARAEQSWLKATSMPDGCDHALPSLNLALLYIEQAKFDRAHQTMNSFEQCVAQFPLRNGEEHRALVHLARGRVALHTGDVSEAIRHLEAALHNRQWFGKIGTNVEDLQAGVLISLATALDVQARHVAFLPQRDIKNLASYYAVQAKRAIRSWWLLRRARQVMAGKLASLEDISIRNTDSMIEYPTFGTFLASFPNVVAKRRIALEEKTDDRRPAHLYYRAYQAENHLNHGMREEGSKLAQEALGLLREQDRLLWIHLSLLRLRLLDPESSSYQDLAIRIHQAMPAALRNAGRKLPVAIDAKSDLREALLEGPFSIDRSASPTFTIRATSTGAEYVFEFSSRSSQRNVVAKHADLHEALSRLQQLVFSAPLA